MLHNTALTKQWATKAEYSSLQIERTTKSRAQRPMATIGLSLTETLVQNLLTARAKSLLHTSKQYRVEVTWCCCNSDMKFVHKIQDFSVYHRYMNLFYEIFFLW